MSNQTVHTVTLNISEDQFNSMLEAGLGSIPTETLSEILVECLKKCLEEYGSELFMHRTGINQYEPSTEMRSILNRVNIQDDMQPIIDEIRDYLLKNYESVLKTCIVGAIASMLFTKDREWEMKASIRDQIMRDLDINRY